MRQIIIHEKSKKFPLLLALVSIILLLGCGNDKTTCTAPAGSTIVITGPDIYQGIAADTCANLVALVSYPDGSPMPKACIDISGSFAFPRNATVTFPRYQFYYYPKCDVVANLAVDSGFGAQTDNSGVYSFSALITAGSGTFTDTIFVRSGANVGTKELGVQ